MIKTSAPGSLIMFGEHSVLRKKHAIVLALQKRIFIELEQNKTKKINIVSSLAHYSATIGNIVVEPPFQYVLQTLKNFSPSTGLDIKIISEMSSDMGFGTSAAVVVALLGGLMTLRKQNLNGVFGNALKVVLKVQERGSGADIMASLKGGIGLYQSSSFIYQPLSLGVNLFGVYSGIKTPTPQVIQYVRKKFSSYPNILHGLDEANEILTLEVIKHLDNSYKLGDLFNMSAGLMEAFGVSNDHLSNFLWGLRKQSYGVKLSGSGLGDCAIGVVRKGVYPEGSFPIKLAQQGLLVESYD